MNDDFDADARALYASLTAIDEQLRVLEAERRHVIAQIERAWTRPVPPGAASSEQAAEGLTFAPPRAVATRHEFDSERARNVLLGLGTALLALAALAFTAVAWAHVGDAGRALLLVGATGTTAALAVAARRRLRATSEALTGLAVLLALIDWYALRRAGVAPGTSAATW